MSAAGVLLVAAPVLPGLLAAACISAAARRWMPLLLIVAPVPALLAALTAAGASPVTIRSGIVPMTLALDLPAALLLGTAALLWIGAAAYAAVERGGGAHSARFAVCWLLTLAGSCGVFIAADLASFFLAYALVSIPAYGLVANDETVLLIAFVLLAAGVHDGTLAIHDVMAALPASPWREAALALLIAGFGMKIALVPLHMWMPLTYRAAPIPAAAVLSGAAVKAGVIGLIRFLPLGAPAIGAGEVLAAVGLLGAFYGVAVGVTQPHPKTVLAYSSISQMGLIAAVLGAGWAAGDTQTGLATAFYAAHHVLAKGALFLAVGVAAVDGGRRPWRVLVPAAVVALGLGGLPLTGGALAKLAVKGPLGDGTVAMLANVSAAGSTLLMLHFLLRLRALAVPVDGAAQPSPLAVPWLALALAAVLVPWALDPLTGGSLADAIGPYALWGSLWPVLLGVALAIVLAPLQPRLPRLPEGDVLAATDGVVRAAVRAGGAIERAEGALREWPAASLALLGVALLLGVSMFLAR
jgi:formate hydrogenlyase subunit 3/multisubunit Na+/H+ antiporter MnhD subunit